MSTLNNNNNNQNHEKQLMTLLVAYSERNTRQIQGFNMLMPRICLTLAWNKDHSVSKVKNVRLLDAIKTLSCSTTYKIICDFLIKNIQIVYMFVAVDL